MKASLQSAARSTQAPAVRVRGGRGTKSPLVLCYHAVSEGWDAALAVTPEALERQVAGLLRAGYAGATFHEVVADPAPGRIAITFDDAYRSVLRLALPVLSELGVPATVFAPTAFVGSERPMSWPGISEHAEGPHAEELVPLSWDELGSLTESGWEVGSHTRTHPWLSALDRADALAELEGSRRECEERLGAPCRSLAYPYGDYNAAVVAAADEAGYEAAGTLARQVQRAAPLTWPRVGIYRHDTGVRFRLKLSPAVRRLRASRAWSARRWLGDRRPGAGKEAR